jgi:hypothetical protein
MLASGRASRWHLPGLMPKFGPTSFTPQRNRGVPALGRRVKTMEKITRMTAIPRRSEGARSHE